MKDGYRVVYGRGEDQFGRRIIERRGRASEVSEVGYIHDEKIQRAEEKKRGMQREERER